MLDGGRGCSRRGGGRPPPTTCSSAATPFSATSPVIGHGRYLLESIGRELRRYITTRNDEEPPFTRDQRRWVYASSKRVAPQHLRLGTDIEFTDGYTIMKHRTFSQFPPSAAPHAGEHLRIPSAKILGGARGRAEAFRPDSVVNISA